MIMTEDEFIRWLAHSDTSKKSENEIQPPDCFYKKSGEVNAEKIMMLVLKARSIRKNKPPVMAQAVIEKDRVGSDPEAVKT